MRDATIINEEHKGRVRAGVDPMESLEVLRQEFLAITEGPARPTGMPRRRRHEVETFASGEHETYTCRVCGEDRDRRKFPTVSGRPGERETRCRSCRDGKAAHEGE